MFNMNWTAWQNTLDAFKIKDYRKSTFSASSGTVLADGLSSFRTILRKQYR